MRQAWDRWKASIRNRMLDTWWLIREGPRAGNWRPVLGVVLVLGLTAALVLDVALLFRSMAREPVTTIPAEDGIPPVDISEESTSFVGDPLVEPEVRGRTIAAESQAPDGSERGERSKDENDRDKPEKDPSPEPSPTEDPTGSASTDSPSTGSGSSGTTGDGSSSTSDSPPADGTADDSGGGIGPGGSGGDSGSTGGDSGSTGGGGGGG